MLSSSTVVTIDSLFIISNFERELFINIATDVAVLSVDIRHIIKETLLPLSNKVADYIVSIVTILFISPAGAALLEAINTTLSRDLSRIRIQPRIVIKDEIEIKDIHIIKRRALLSPFKEQLVLRKTRLRNQLLIININIVGIYFKINEFNMY